MKLTSRKKNKLIDDILLWVDRLDICKKYWIDNHEYYEIKDNSLRLRYKVINWVEYMVCKNCKNQKEYNEENYEKRHDNGKLRKICRDCRNIANKVRKIKKPIPKEKIAEYKRKHYEKNKIHYIEYMRKYRANNKERIRQIKLKAYYKKQKNKLNLLLKEKRNGELLCKNND